MLPLLALLSNLNFRPSIEMLNFILLQASGQGGSPYGSWAMIALMGLVFYIFIIRPQQKKQKSQKQFTESVKKGDMIVTMGGIHGKILAMDDATISLEIDKGTKMKIEKTSISLESSKKLSGK